MREVILLVGLILICVVIESALSLCPAGQYTKDGACADCIGGKYRKDGDPDHACHFCPPSHYSKSEASECIECPENTGFNYYVTATSEYGYNRDRTSSSYYGSGTYSYSPPKFSFLKYWSKSIIHQSTRSEACEPCLGKYTRVKGASFCNNCPPGTFVTDCKVHDSTPPSQTPTAAPSRYNRYNRPTSGKKAPTLRYFCYCKQCQDSTYSATYGNTQCSRCPLGKIVKTVESTLDFSFANHAGKPESTNDDNDYQSGKDKEMKEKMNKAGFYRKISYYPKYIQGTSWIYQGELPDYLLGNSPQYGHQRVDDDILPGLTYYDADGNKIETFGVPSGDKTLRFFSGQTVFSLNTDCEDCPMGKYGSKDDSCIPCSAGKFSDATGLSECLACPEGKYQSRTGAASCRDCPPNKDSTTGSTECLLNKKNGHKAEPTPNPAPTPGPSSAGGTNHVPVAGDLSPTPRPSAFFSHDVVHEVTHEVVVEETNTTLVWTVVLLNVLVCVLLVILYRTCVRKHVGGAGDGTEMYSTVSGDQLEDVSITPLRAGNREDVPPLPL